MRTILHADLNSCYASVECAVNPALRDVPLAVGGNKELRHGIILAKNELAKKAGVQTGEAIWQAQKKCPHLVIVEPHYALYKQYCERAREIYLQYTDCVESFGPDECWLDVTGSLHLFGSGEKIAHEIRNRIREELQVTVSVGVSWNKTFAKFGSDYKKPDAVTVITPENYRHIVWPCPTGDLLFVGRATQQRLRNRGIFTVGDIVESGLETMKSTLGKNGETLYMAAAGMDFSPVKRYYEADPVKSVGNSATPARDLKNEADARLLLYILSDSVARRLRVYGLSCTGVQLYLRDTQLNTLERQLQFAKTVSTAYEICNAGLLLLRRHWDFVLPLRSIGIRAIGLQTAQPGIQTCLFAEERRLQNKEILECTADRIRERFGQGSIFRAVLLGDRTLSRSALPSEAPTAFAAAMHREQKLQFLTGEGR